MGKPQDSNVPREHEESRSDSGKPSATEDGAGGQPEPREVGGRDGPDPTRYGDWEKAGRCIDF